MAHTKSRVSPRRSKLLTSYRCVQDGAVTSSGFGRTVQLDGNGALLESPDAFSVGQPMVLQFLLDDDRVSEASGHVVRIRGAKGMYRVEIAFDSLPASTRRRLARQGAG
ncbi:MAG: PilZ domain-containing protein [Chloroflexi bacterium]|nr:PilZ domain-containing protein [Chloroflexota bacterium]